MAIITSDIAIYKIGGLERSRGAKLSPLVYDEGKYIGSAYIDERFKETLQPEVKGLYRQRLGAQLNAQRLNEDDVENYVESAMLHIEQSQIYMHQKHTYGMRAVGGRVQKAEFELSLPDPAETEVQAVGVAIKSAISIRIRKRDFFESAFQEQCTKVWEQCKLQMEKLGARLAVEWVVLADGFGSSPYVLESLSKNFSEYARYHHAIAPRVNQIESPQIATCRDLVYDELSNIHGTSLWVHPAAAS